MPPNTVLRKSAHEPPFAIGTEARIVEPLFPAIKWDVDSVSGESMLLKLAYPMQHAKTGDMYAGGHTNAVVIRADGTCAWASREEMKAAEEFSPRID